jgi:hypothetical protein
MASSRQDSAGEGSDSTKREENGPNADLASHRSRPPALLQSRGEATIPSPELSRFNPELTRSSPKAISTDAQATSPGPERIEATLETMSPD